MRLVKKKCIRLIPWFPSGSPKNNAKRVTKIQPVLRGSGKHRCGYVPVRSMASADIGAGMFWNTSLSSLPVFVFLFKSAFTSRSVGFFPRACAGGIRVTLHGTVLYTAFAPDHRKKFWPRYAKSETHGRIAPEIHEWIGIISINDQNEKGLRAHGAMFGRTLPVGALIARKRIVIFLNECAAVKD